MAARVVHSNCPEEVSTLVPSVRFFPIDNGSGYEMKPWRKALAVANTIIALTILIGILVLLLHRLFVIKD